MKILYLYVADNNLRNLYHEAAYTRNVSIEQNRYPDSGFDLFLSQDYSVEKGVCKIDYEVRAAMYENGVPQAFCIYPRSSIYKTPLRMTKSVGIIDSGYRGNLMSFFDASDAVNLKKGNRLTQICSPVLDPFRIVVVDSMDELGRTERGEGGFGSTGL
jgi:dUTP pyrophosphatase